VKCVHCGRISRLRERTDGRCPGCQHRFAFDPEARPAAGTDAEFQAAIDRVSGGGQLRFTTRQLWLAVHGKSTMPPFPPVSEGFIVLPALGFALPGLFMAAFAEPGMLILAVVGGMVGAALGWGAAQTARDRYADQLRPCLPFDVFLSGQLRPWVEVHGKIPGLLSPHGTDVATAPPQVPADVASWDRAVVTDRRETAKVLVANGFDIEHKCAVLSRDGYPDGAADTIKGVLRRNPRLTVFALHDASPDGCQLPLDLREPGWFPEPSVRVVDLGLQPETVRRLELPWIPGSPVQWPSWTPELIELLSYEDRRWLAVGNVFELAALPSAHLMRVAYEGIVAAGPNDGSDRDPAYDDAPWTGVAAWFKSLTGGGPDAAVVDGFG
jgi:hypothetical protein